MNIIAKVIESMLVKDATQSWNGQATQGATSVWGWNGVASVWGLEWRCRLRWRCGRLRRFTTLSRRGASLRTSVNA